MPCASTAYVLFIVWHCSLPALIISYLGYNINRCIFDCLHGIITIYYTQKNCKGGSYELFICRNCFVQYYRNNRTHSCHPVCGQVSAQALSLNFVFVAVTLSLGFLPLQIPFQCSRPVPLSKGLPR